MNFWDIRQLFFESLTIPASNSALDIRKSGRLV